VNFRPRERSKELPEAPAKIYEAPEVNGDERYNIIDWGP
jgi:hypothetical protein